MSRAHGERFNSGRWCFVIPSSAPEFASNACEELVENVVAALEGRRGAPFRRSRHATTWKVRIARLTGESASVFVKQIDAARGFVSRLKAKSRAKRSEHVLRISEDLRRHNFGVPSVPLIGENRDTGDEVVVMSEASGFMLTRWMNPSHHIEVTLRRRILHQLGAEIARLHLTGYIHGDLTPYNIFATDDHEIGITFIDHEGTEKTSRVSINVARNRMRNLVQLGHFDTPGVSRTDKFRVFASYAATAGFSKRASRQSLRRLTKMIDRRRKRDRASKHAASQPAIMAEEGAARG
jgi:tRNA A-37 threonylcarbamoyl transferase component Bud32